MNFLQHHATRAVPTTSVKDLEIRSVNDETHGLSDRWPMADVARSTTTAESLRCTRSVNEGSTRYMNKMFHQQRLTHMIAGSKQRDSEPRRSTHEHVPTRSHVIYSHGWYSR